MTEMFGCPFRQECDFVGLVHCPLSSRQHPMGEQRMQKTLAVKEEDRVERGGPASAAANGRFQGGNPALVWRPHCGGSSPITPACPDGPTWRAAGRTGYGELRTLDPDARAHRCRQGRDDPVCRLAHDHRDAFCAEPRADWRRRVSTLAVTLTVRTGATAAPAASPTPGARRTSWSEGRARERIGAKLGAGRASGDCRAPGVVGPCSVIAVRSAGFAA